MIDPNEDRESGARSPHDAQRRRGDRPRHMIVNDGELLDIGPDAETIDDAELRSSDAHEPSAGDVRAATDDDASPGARLRFGSAGSGGAEREPGPDRR